MAKAGPGSPACHETPGPCRAYTAGMLRALALLLTLLTPDAAADAPASPEGLDATFYAAVAGAPATLEDILAPQFVYRTATGSTLGKEALIAHLRSGRTRVHSPAVSVQHTAMHAATLLSAGTVTLQVVDGDSIEPGSVEASFLHVWSNDGRAWRLLYRESDILRRPSTPPTPADVN